MLKTPHGLTSSKHREVPAPWSLVVFRVGGHVIAAKAQEVGGVWPWPGSVAVPSSTPWVRSIIRRGEQILPVFDLAGRLNVTVKGARPLCLIVRHHDGALAICIDEDIPILQTVDGALIRTRAGEAGQVGTCEIGSETVPIYALSRLTGSES